MDKNTAMEYLRTLKQSTDEMTALLSQGDSAIQTLCGKRGVEQSVRRYIVRIGRDIEQLADSMQGQARVEPEIETEIDALIERLNLLRARTTAGAVADIEINPDY